MADDIVVFKDRFEISTNERLREFDSPDAEAYSCTSRSGEEPNVMALLCDPGIPIRMNAVEALHGMSSPAMLRFVEHGVVNWPARKRRMPILIVGEPGGDRVFADEKSTIAPMSDEDVTKNFLTPISSVLREMSQRGISHRAIRPTNMFYTDNSKRMIQLGECLSSPPGMHQPLWLESLDCSMADSSARGEGGLLDDLFALGICVLTLILGRNPLANVDPTRLVEDRINAGSYATIVGSHRIQPNMVELLRGLLTDDPRERWSLREIDLWVGGRRLTPKQAKLPPKAGRPLEIAGIPHENVRSVAHGMGRNWMMSPEIIRGQDFESWLRRSLNDEAMSTNISKIVGNPAHGGGSATEDARLVTRMALCLDPSAPLRHQGISAHPDGIGTMLAVNFKDDSIRQKVADLINAKVVSSWMSLQARTKPELMVAYTTLERLPTLLNQGGPGYGIERALYELNPFIHCMSPMIDHFHITRPEEVLPALEAVAQGQNLPPLPMDRHIAAFLGARSRDIEERYLRPLGIPEDRPAAEPLAVLRILARLQTGSRNGPMPGVSSWLATLCQPAVDSYHNLKGRKTTENLVKRARDTGQLSELVAVFDDVKAMQRDEQGYARAMQEHKQCEGQIQQMNMDLENRESLAGELGGQAAAIIAGVASSVGIAAEMLFFFI